LRLAGVKRRSALVGAAMLAVAVAVAVAVTVAGCASVDLGTPPADVNACRPGQQFFIDQIWPNFLAKDYSGKHCYDSGCHGDATTTMLRIPPPTSVAAIPLPLDWSADYISASEAMDCSTVKSSALLMNPSGEVVHGGGMLIQPDGPEAMLIEMWVTQP
jgi:hypothetical protein